MRFDPIIRDVREADSPLRIGRFTDRTGLGLAAANAMGSNKLAFKSKVVSRAHAEIWVESGGRFFIKDTKSSSGTFLNHVRLSAANMESVPKELRDGDLLQLGVDYQGGAEDIYKCVKIKVEVGREWQAHSNPFKYVSLSFFSPSTPFLIPSVPAPTLSNNSRPLQSLQALTLPKRRSRLKPPSRIAASVRNLPPLITTYYTTHVLSIYLSSFRFIRSHHQPSTLHRSLLTCLSLQMYPSPSRKPPPGIFMSSLSNIRQSRRRRRSGIGYERFDG